MEFNIKICSTEGDFTADGLGNVVERNFTAIASHEYLSLVRFDFAEYEEYYRIRPGAERTEIDIFDLGCQS